MMIDDITLARIKHLHPSIKDKVEAMYKNEIAPLLTGNVGCRFSYTLRSFEEQAVLYAQGRTKLYDSLGKRLGIVTNAKPGYSYHQYGLAVDIVLIDGKAAYWDKHKDYDGDNISDWKEVANVFLKNGWIWGDSWGDSPHFQFTAGYTVEQLLEKYVKKQFISGTTYVKL